MSERPGAAAPPSPSTSRSPSTFRHTLVRVMGMQLVALALLALLQLRYNA